MEQISTVRELLALWPTRADLVADVCAYDEASDVNVGRVHKWARANAIPAKYQNSVLQAASFRGFAVTAELMVRLHATERSAA